MNSQLGRLNLRDLLHSLAGAIIVSVLAVLQSIIKEKGLSLTAEDGLNVLNAAIQGALGVLSVKLLSDQDGKLGGRL